MNKRLVIVGCVIAALVFTILIQVSAGRRVVEAKRTVDAVQTTRYIPAGAEIPRDAVKAVKVPEAIGASLIPKPEDVAGKVARVALVEGQYVWKDSVGVGRACRPGFVEVYVPVDLSSSACVIAGETVDVYPIAKSAGEMPMPTTPLAQGLRVLHSLDQSGKEIDPTKRATLSKMAGTDRNIPVSVGLEVPQAFAQQIVSFASKKAVYLAKCPPPEATPGA
ncbi:MAG: SAF domain-containing protein [Thermoanaerobacterales bacterium]|nr:SAF domain-containing protein [Thermoanaerobacterales bacterium]